jgi:hypothetical protein
MKLRFGVLVWLLSWVPYGVLLGVSGVWYAVTLAFEVLLGLVGIALAGSSFADTVKAVGWRRAPAAALHALVSGEAGGEAR